MLYRDQGIVLRTHKLGEADRIISLVTRDHGKVRAVAKGVRKTASRFGARLEPTMHVALQLYQGRELDTVTQVETIDHFRPLRDDLNLLTRAIGMLEAVDQVAQEREPDPDLYRMLLGALRTIADGGGQLVAPAFYLKLMAHDGVRPVTEGCVVCGTPDDLVAFDATEGGVLCRLHRRGVPISPQALDVLRDILDGRLARALARPEDESIEEVSHLAVRALEAHLERRLRSQGLI